MPQAEIIMPQMGVSVEEGTVVVWRVAVGDRVHRDQVVCEVATDKVDAEVTAQTEGVVRELLVPEGETVAVGAPLALVTQGDAEASVEDRHIARANAGANTDEVDASDTREGSPLAGASIDPGAAASAALARVGRRAGTPASPVARRLAADHGVDLSTVRGSGRAGRIRKSDVLGALAQRESPRQSSSQPLAPSAAVSASDLDLPSGYDDVPFDAVTTSHQRRAIAEHMIRSRRTAAHMTTEVEVDMDHVSRVRELINDQLAGVAGPRVSFLSFIARAAVATLAGFPDLNATFQHERMVRWKQVNLGIAVDTPTGLIVPVLRDAERMTVTALAEAIAELAERARSRRLSPDDVRAGTFTISNPGSVGAISAPAIINQPQVAILGTPAIVKRPWVVQTADGTDVITPRPIMKLALTFDHRAVDGANATGYVVQVKQLLESWDARDYL